MTAPTCSDKVFNSKKVSVIILLLVTATVSYGQDKQLRVDVNADLVSSYVWRGLYQAGASIQPSLSLSAYGLTIGSWGSTDFSSSFKEIDFFISYELQKVAVSLSDYWWSGEGESFFKERASHHFEAGLNYTFSDNFPLSLGVNTIFYGREDRSDEDKQLYSTYIEASYPFSMKNVDCELSIGISPWRGMYSADFNVASITARASKELQVSEKFALPVFIELILSPSNDNTFIIFGLKF